MRAKKKVGHNGAIVSCAVLIAIGVDERGTIKRFRLDFFQGVLAFC